MFRGRVKPVSSRQNGATRTAQLRRVRRSLPGRLRAPKQADSLHTQTGRLRRFREDFQGRSLDISHSELKQWVHGEGPWSHRGPIPRWEPPAITSLYNHAIDEDDLPLARNPARKLRRSPRRPVNRRPAGGVRGLLSACSALGDYGKMMRAALLFATYTFIAAERAHALDWTDVDFGRMRIHIHDSRKTRRRAKG